MSLDPFGIIVNNLKKLSTWVIINRIHKAPIEVGVKKGRFKTQSNNQHIHQILYQIKAFCHDRHSCLTSLVPRLKQGSSKTAKGSWCAQRKTKWVISMFVNKKLESIIVISPNVNILAWELKITLKAEVDCWKGYPITALNFIYWVEGNRFQLSTTNISSNIWF